MSQALALNPAALSGTVPLMRAYDARERRRRRTRRSPVARRRVVLLVLLGIALLVTLLLAAFGSPGEPPRPAAIRSAASPAEPPLPQPIARQGSLQLQLPISQESLTAVGYHGGGETALPLDPVGRQRNEGLFERIFHSLFGSDESGISYYRLGGGEGPATGAVDVGALPGTDVYSPVTGQVVSIRDYVLDGKPYGHQIDIQPSGTPSVVVTLTHLRADPSLTVGAPVTAGGSKLGVVLDFTTVEQQALAKYTKDGGNHVTMSVHPAATLSLR